VATVAVGLGANLGDRRSTLGRAAASLGRLGERTAVSPLYETAPVGGPPQPDYLNAVVVLETPLGPRAVLEGLLGLEREAGRIRRRRWGPRSLDLDLLLYGDREVDEPGLRVPHPRMAERRFVLEPLLAAWPEARLPDGTTVVSLLGAVSGQEVRRVAGPEWAGEA
jgi:2-amino-4-hydroxy-6-hydroxymethyldihydropteridine diphosphokinase